MFLLNASLFSEAELFVDDIVAILCNVGRVARAIGAVVA